MKNFLRLLLILTIVVNNVNEYISPLLNIDMGLLKEILLLILQNRFYNISLNFLEEEDENISQFNISKQGNSTFIRNYDIYPEESFEIITQQKEKQ